MQIVSLTEVHDGRTIYVRHSDSLDVTTPNGTVVTVRDERARQLWRALLAEACVEVGLRADASMFEIRAWLEGQ